MQCVNCGKLRHEGPCEEPNDLEFYLIEAQRALERFEDKRHEMETRDERRS